MVSKIGIYNYVEFTPVSLKGRKLDNTFLCMQAIQKLINAVQARF